MKQQAGVADDTHSPEIFLWDLIDELSLSEVTEDGSEILTGQ